jgi:hypothetical protein
MSPDLLSALVKKSIRYLYFRKIPLHRFCSPK